MDRVYKQYFSYIAFAVVAIAINVGCQALVEFLAKNFIPSIAFFAIEVLGKQLYFWFGLALVSGTLVGFIFKFIVDKWIIFRDRLKEDETLAETGKQITKYFGFAIFTTIIFWGTEGLFYLLLGEEWYLIGGVIGLSIGYTVKFIVDRHYVFKQYFSYIAFAVVAIAINVGCQALVEFLAKNFIPSIAFFAIEVLGKQLYFWFGLALVSGTLVGFIFKFIVDKWIIFRDRLKEDETLAETGKQITKYFGFAIFTTIIFWGTEGLFYLLLGEEWYLIGGVIGLSIGYTVKFILDRQYVFTEVEKSPQ
ncbi:MAG: GtrA family protein [Candidatus Odinarchaeota archaeon]